jgi:hypothetical protein
MLQFRYRNTSLWATPKEQVAGGQVGLARIQSRHRSKHQIAFRLFRLKGYLDSHLAPSLCTTKLEAMQANRRSLWQTMTMHDAEALSQTGQNHGTN